MKDESHTTHTHTIDTSIHHLTSSWLYSKHGHYYLEKRKKEKLKERIEFDAIQIWKRMLAEWESTFFAFYSYQKKKKKKSNIKWKSFLSLDWRPSPPPTWHYYAWPVASLYRMRYILFHSSLVIQYFWANERKNEKAKLISTHLHVFLSLSLFLSIQNWFIKHEW